MITLVLITITSIAVLMGVLVWGRRTENDVNRSFLGLSLALAFWIATNAIFVASSDQRLQYTDALLSYIAAGLVAAFFLDFSLKLTFIRKFNAQLLYGGIVFSLLSGVPNILATGVNEDRIITTPLIALYALYIVLYLLGGAITLALGRRKVLSRRRSQIDTVLIGAVAAMIGGAVCNLLLPMLGSYQFVAFGPACALVFVYFFAYSVIRHHLFDIRRAFGRAIAYGLAVVVLGVGFGLAVNVIGELLMLPPAWNEYLLIGSSVAIAAFYSPVKRIFDNATKKFFYRSEYEIQDAIDQMTDIFARVQTERGLINSSTKQLNSILGSRKIDIVDFINDETRKYIRRNKVSIFFREDIEERKENETLIANLAKKEVAVVALLKSEGRQVGYMLIGDKANGTSYSKHDYQFLDILVDEFAIALENTRRMERIKSFNDDLKNEIQDATSALRASNKRLHELDQSKDEFISMASHQLRTPLTSVKGYISMVLDGDMGEITPQQRKVLEEAYTSSQRMAFLIGDFLNLSRLQTGKFELELSDIDMSHIVGEEISQLRATAASRGIKLAYDSPENFPVLKLDENKIRQVMMNFIDNAIYYSPANTIITISIVKHAHHVTFRVEDQGIGVPKGERHRLFTKFYRAGNAKKQRPDGTGIGLFMAKKVIVAHGGSVIFESEEGKGSTFGFRLPV